MAAVSHQTVRAQLVADLARLDEQLVALGHGHGKASTDLEFDENFADHGQVTAERGEVEALASTLEDHRGDVERALAKLDGGTYGTCEKCSQEIAEARLEANPVATLCITCASKRR